MKKILWISQEPLKLYRKIPPPPQEYGNIAPLTVENGILKKLNRILFLIVLGPLNPQITFLGEKL